MSQSQSESIDGYPTANRIIQMSDDELVHFMRRHRASDGSLHIQFLEECDEDERDKLVEKLRHGAAIIDRETEAHPLDANKLTALLSDIQNGDSRPSERADTASTGPTVPASPQEPKEIKMYYVLVSEGGRPLYPVSLVSQVSGNPMEFHDMLLPWQTENDYSEHILDWRVFRTQVQRWHMFREWQLDNREEMDLARRTAYFDQRKTLFADVVYDAAFHVDLETAWRKHRELRLRYWKWLRRSDRGTFAGYCEEATQRLKAYGMTQTFAFDEDPALQDRLTTWIEYLFYEVCYLENYTQSTERRAPLHRAAWDKLLASGHYEEGDTINDMASMEGAWKRGERRKQAKAAVEAATVSVHKARDETAAEGEDMNGVSGRVVDADAGHAGKSKALEDAEAQLATAKESLAAAEAAQVQIITFLEETSSYCLAFRREVQQKRLVDWVLAQIPLIEAELNEKGTSGSGNAPDEPAPPQKRRCDEEDGPDDAHGRSPKRQKQDHAEPHTDNEAVKPEVSADEPQAV